MQEKRLSVTEIAKQAIIDDNILLEKYSTAQSVLEFLEDDSHFKKISDVLRDALIESGNCTEDQPLEEFISKLQDLSKEQGIDSYLIERWLTEDTHYIKSRYNTIRLCFALNFNREKSNEFLNKCGHYSLSFRNAEDVTFIYCILKGKTYPDAEKLYAKYVKEKVNTDKTLSEEEPTPHTGQTTKNLAEGFNIESWETDDDFFHSYLMKNKRKFINYERTALTTYYIWKNEFYFSVIHNDLIEEYALIDERNEYGNQSAKPVRALAINSALAKYSDPNSLLFPAYKIMNDKLVNCIAALNKVKQISMNHQDLESQRIISEFCIDVIKSEKILKHVLSSLELKGTADTPLFRCVLGFGSGNGLNDLTVGKLAVTETNLEMIYHYCKETNSYGFYIEKNGELILSQPSSNSIVSNQIYAILRLFEETNLTFEEIASLEYRSLRKSNSLAVKTGDDKFKIVKISQETKKAITKYLSVSGRGRLKKKGDSSLYDNESLHGSVMKKFPEGKTLKLPDKDPTTIGKDLSLRKAFILIYFLYYIHCFTLDIQNDDFDSLINEFGFEAAFDQLNDLLALCNLSKLYPADAFDWLILRCLKECHKPNTASEDNDALKFLNSIIGMSYNPERQKEKA